MDSGWYRLERAECAASGTYRPLQVCQRERGEISGLFPSLLRLGGFLCVPAECLPLTFLACLPEVGGECAQRSTRETKSGGEFGWGGTSVKR